SRPIVRPWSATSAPSSAVSYSSTKNSHSATAIPAAVARSRTRLLARHPSATKLAPSRIEVPTIAAKAPQAGCAGPRAYQSASAATPYPATVAQPRIVVCPTIFPTTTSQRETGYDSSSASVPRSCSPTIASKESISAISGTSRIVSDERLTTTTATGSVFTMPVGALPSSASDSASAASTTVVAATHRLRRPMRSSCSAIVTAFTTAERGTADGHQPQGSGNTQRRTQRGQQLASCRYHRTSPD